MQFVAAKKAYATAEKRYKMGSYRMIYGKKRAGSSEGSHCCPYWER